MQVSIHTVTSIYFFYLFRNKTYLSELLLQKANESQRSTFGSKFSLLRQTSINFHAHTWEAHNVQFQNEIKKDFCPKHWDIWTTGRAYNIFQCAHFALQVSWLTNKASLLDPLCKATNAKLHEILITGLTTYYSLAMGLPC